MPIANVEDSDEYWSAEEEIDDDDWFMDGGFNIVSFQQRLTPIETLATEQMQHAGSRLEPRGTIGHSSPRPAPDLPMGRLVHTRRCDARAAEVVIPVRETRKDLTPGQADQGLGSSKDFITPFKRLPPKSVGTPASRMARMQEAFSDYLKLGNGQGGLTTGLYDDATESIASTQPSPTEFTSRNPLTASWSATSFTSTVVDDSLSPSPSFKSIGKQPAQPRPTSILQFRSRPAPQASSSKPALPAQGDLLESCIGRDLDPFIIAHSDTVQQLLDKHNISWGVQYELARGITTKAWDWSDIEGKISGLVGTNAESAHLVSDIIRGRPRRDVVHNFPFELDREQLAIMENRSRGLGLMGEWHGDPDWHGGRIQQIARLQKDDGEYSIRLEPLEKRRSHYYARCHGSRRIIQLRVPDALLKSDMKLIRDFMAQKFILLGRVFVPFVAKEGSLYLVETSEDWRRQNNMLCGDQYRVSFHEFIHQHNPLDLNGKSPIRKWITRFVIGLSNSVPALEFDRQDIYFTADDIAPLGVCDDINDPPPEMIMTDGCGFINEAAAILIARKIGMASRPTAVQGRCMGSKGLWIIHPNDTSPQPKIWIRKSQKKINHHEPAGRHLRIFNLLRTSHAPAPTQISNQSILNMSYNGVPFEVLEKFLVDGLDDLAGNVSRTRIQRIAADFSRVLGYTGHGYDREEDNDLLSSQDSAPVDMDDQAYIVQSGRKPYSGIPVTLHETALELVQAGFHPASSPFLRGKIGYIIEQAIKSVTEKCRIPLPESFSAFIVPDPLGILEEGQVYYRSSQPFKDPKTERLFDTITGNILLGRYPIRLLSDMQKVVAVDIPELRDWTDVLIVSTQGHEPNVLTRPIDVDGDAPFGIMHPEIVEPFQNQEFTDMPPKFFEENFQDTRDIEKVPAFLKRISGLPPNKLQKNFKAAQKRGKAHLNAYASLFSPKKTVDPHLAAPYELATAYATKCWDSHKFKLPCEEMTILRRRVRTLQEQWAAACAKSRPSATKKQSSSKANHTAMVAATRAFHEPLPEVSTIPNVKEILASFAFVESESFAFEVAFQDLCILKARSSSGGIAPLTRQFDECRTIPTSYLRAIARHNEDQA
ncbi:RNA dependent RNA polymerase-domain-containing protein [Infundibulicybe gibba]|nr:RNA dependent RNA polymerase-domain-containing protein [Infundibulicybe gibba]